MVQLCTIFLTLQGGGSQPFLLGETKLIVLLNPISSTKFLKEVKQVSLLSPEEKREAQSSSTTI